MTPWGTLGLGCVHIAQLMTHQVFQHSLILQLCYTLLAYCITKSQKVYISSHDGLQNFIRPTILNMVSRSEDRVAGISFFLHYIQNLSSNKSIILWLQPIHHINICTKPWFPMKVFLRFNLLVQVTLTLIYQIFLNSVNFIAHTCNKNHYLMMKETLVTSKKFHQLSTQFKVSFEVCLKVFQK